MLPRVEPADDRCSRISWAGDAESVCEAVADAAVPPHGRGGQGDGGAGAGGGDVKGLHRSENDSFYPMFMEQIFIIFHVRVNLDRSLP